MRAYLAGFVRGVLVARASEKRRQNVQRMTRSMNTARDDELAVLLLNIAAFREKMKYEACVDLLDPLESVCKPGVYEYIERHVVQWSAQGDFLGANAASVWMFTLQATGHDHAIRPDAKQMWASLRRGMDELRRNAETYADFPLRDAALEIPNGFRF